MIGICAPDGVPTQLLWIVSEVALIANRDREPLPALHILSDTCSTNLRGDDSLNICHGEPVAGRLGSIHFDVQIKALRNSFGENRTRVWHTREDLLDLGTDILNSREIGALDFQTDCGLDSG